MWLFDLWRMYFPRSEFQMWPTGEDKEIRTQELKDRYAHIEAKREKARTLIDERGWS